MLDFKNNVWYLVILVLQMVAGSSILRAQQSLPIKGGELNGRCWIASAQPVALQDSLLFGDHPAPLFRKEFSISGRLKRASLNITAAGYYRVSFNGRGLENNILDPAWTDFGKLIYSVTYDVTDYLKNGVNALGVELGNGFYNALPMRMFGRFNLRDVLPTGLPQFVARLSLSYSDGRTEEVVPDGSWKTAEGAYVRNNVYLGVLYDARKEIKGWNLPGFEDRSWRNAVLTAGPGGEIQESFFPAVKIQKTIRAVDIRRNGKKIIVDMGINLTGIYRIKLKGETGDTIQFRFGERLYENGSLNPMTTVAGQIKRKGSGGPGAPDIAWQCDRYVFGDLKEAFFQPQFTFHTFRYMEISGLKYLPEKMDIEGLAFHSDVENGNHFECSNELLNRIQQACRQTFLNNLISVQSDCPARERFGYGGDLNATSEAFMDNFAMHGFYRKTVYDWLDGMQDSIFIDTAPFVGIKYCGISWESAFLTTQYRLFEYYGDTLLVDELYRKDLAWMDKVNRLHPDGLVEKGLSDHESMVKVPVELIGTTHYLDCARIMQRFSKLKKDKQNVERFQALEQSLSRKLLDHFWYHPVQDPINRQTLFATLIYYGLIPAGELPAAVDSLLKAVRREPEGHFTTGIFGTKYILEALSSTGHVEEVYRIVNSSAFPGWGYMVDRGATTLWEAWKESDNTYSNCHPMFGSVSEWLYRWLAGIRPAEDHPGFKEFVLSPTFPPGLNELKAIYEAPEGVIKVAWKRDATDGIDLTFSIPKGTTAHFNSLRKAQSMREVTNVNREIKFNSGLTGTSVVLGEGSYSVRL